MPNQQMFEAQRTQPLDPTLVPCRFTTTALVGRELRFDAAQASEREIASRRALFPEATAWPSQRRRT
eukprot:3964651-Pleurochrysis_carterae.AAC.1